MPELATRKAVYAGSFDPPTNGHLYVIREGARLFDALVVAVGTNPGKAPDFPAQERVAMIRSVTSDLKNVEVVLMEGEFLVNFARSLGAGYVLRGVRNESDFLVERTMRNVNADIAPEVTTVFLMPPREIADISSSFVKGLVGPGGWRKVAKRYVPGPVFKALERWSREGSQECPS